MRISDWSSDVCSSDLDGDVHPELGDAERGVVVDVQAERRRQVQRREEPGVLRVRGVEGLEQLPAGVSAVVEVVVARGDRKSVGEGKSVSVRVDLGGRRLLKKKR